MKGWVWPTLPPGQRFLEGLLADQMLFEGNHVHMAPHGIHTCLGGESECGLWQLQLEQAQRDWNETQDQDR